MSIIGIILLLLLVTVSPISSFDRPQYICLNEAFPNSWLVDHPETFTQESIDWLLNNVSNVKGHKFGYYLSFLFSYSYYSNY